jgi:hypothetical protein
MTLAEAQKIVNEYGAVLASKKAMINDVSGLPYPKIQIKAALILAIAATEDKVMRSNLRSSYISLADWQQGIGMGPNQFDALKANPSDADLLKAAKRIVEAAPKTEKINKLVKAETDALVDELKCLGLWAD